MLAIVTYNIFSPDDFDDDILIATATVTLSYCGIHSVIIIVVNNVAKCCWSGGLFMCYNNNIS